MSNIKEIIRQIYRDLFCPVCGKSYKIDQLNIRGIVGQTLAVQTTCSNGHATLFMTSLGQIEQIKSEPISANDCIDIHYNLKKFNGDFVNLWKSH